ncbi:MAG: diguanylate cyclase [Pseudomonadota bacterium]
MHLLRPSPIRGVLRSAAAAALALAVPGAAHAAEPVVRVWDADDGLLQHTVVAIAQAPEGYLWLGTGAGLYRFDGVHFERYLQRDLPGLVGDRISALAVDGEQVLWIGTPTGVSRMRDGVVLDPTPAQQACGAFAFGLDELRRVWTTCSGGRVGILGPDTHARGALEAASDRPYGIHFGPGGDIWVLGEAGSVWRWREATRAVEAIAPIPPGVRVVATDGVGAALLGGLEGLHRWSNGALTPVSSAAVTSIGANVDGERLVGFRDGQLARYRTGEPLVPLRRLPSAIRDTYRDPAGGIWAGTQEHGLARLGPRRVETRQVGPSQDSQSVHALFKDSRGGLWTAVDCDGARRWIDGALDRRLPAFPSRDESCIWAFAEDPEGTLWLGSWSGGVSRYDLDAGRLLDVLGPEQGGLETVLALLPAGADGLWVGGADGLVRWRDGAFERPEAMADLREVIHLRLDEVGLLWIGTRTGLCHWDGADLACFGPALGLPVVNTRDTFAIAPGEVLVASYGAGLQLFEGQRFRPLQGSVGLQDLFLSRVMADGLGGVWISGNSGLYQIPLAELRRVIQDPGAVLDPIRLGLDDGMPSAECNGGNTSAGLVDASGTLYVPTLQGVAVVDTRAVRWEEQLPPLPRIEAVLAGDQAIRDGPVLVDPGRRDLEVRYTAFHFAAPEQIRFRYRLDGGPWRDAGARRVAGFAGFSAGLHRIEVAARIASGAWSEPAGVDFRALPTWHERFAVRIGAALCVLLTGLLGWLAMRRRQQHIQRLVDEATRELAEANRQLAAQANVDGLTGVAARRSFEERLALYWKAAHRSGQPLSLLMVDLDGFKALNDRHGHPVGDRCLVEVAASLTRASRRDLDLVARYGGDELAVLLPDSGSAGALRVAERALAEVRRLQLGPDPAGRPVTVSVSIGSATSSPREGGLPADLVNAADQALYLAKAQGRNRVVAARGAARAAAEE